MVAVADPNNGSKQLYPSFNFAIEQLSEYRHTSAMHMREAYTEMMEALDANIYSLHAYSMKLLKI